MGGYVNLRRQSREPLCCALTCHHLLRPAKPHHSLKSSGSSYDSTLDNEGIYHPAVEEPDPGVLVEQPGLADHHEMVDGLSAHSTSLQDLITEYEDKIAMGMDRVRYPSRPRGVTRTSGGL